MFINLNNWREWTITQILFYNKHIWIVTECEKNTNKKRRKIYSSQSQTLNEKWFNWFVQSRAHLSFHKNTKTKKTLHGIKMSNTQKPTNTTTLQQASLYVGDLAPDVTEVRI